jgi:trk system potassium uptake protein TrkA
VKIVIVGAGEVGFHIASRLAGENKDVVVIDRDAEALRRVSDNLDVQVLQGSGASPVALEEAGIRRAEILLAVTDSDETNLVACLATNLLSPSTKKLIRLRDAAYDGFHETFREQAPHIDTIINPEIEVVRTIERMMQVPGAVDVGEFADGRIRFVGIHLAPDAPITGARLLELPERFGPQRPLIAAVMRGEEIIVPRGSDRLLAGDLVYFIGEAGKLGGMLPFFGIKPQPVRRVLVVGGGRIGQRLAARLEELNIHCKIIEKNADRCARLAERLNKTVILHGDGSDRALLVEENIGEMDYVVTLTSDEETNILVSLLSMRMGAARCITKISRFSYFPIMTTIGIEQVVSPRLSAIDSILRHIRRGKVLSAISLKEQAEVLEAVALETSDIVSKPLKNIHFPKGTLVAGIVRDTQIIIPSGASVIEPGDRIIIFAQREAVPKIEKLLAVKLEFF